MGTDHWLLVLRVPVAELVLLFKRLVWKYYYKDWRLKPNTTFNTYYDHKNQPKAKLNGLFNVVL